MELWSRLESLGLRNYEISTTGQVRRTGSDVTLNTSLNQRGVRKVNLRVDGRYTTFPVAALVAAEFLRRKNHEPADRFNTVIHLDGDKSNARLENLRWRPRWFTYKYHSQFHNGKRGYIVPILNCETEEIFPTSWFAAIRYGLLDIDIRIHIMNRTPLFPTWQRFRLLSKN